MEDHGEAQAHRDALAEELHRCGLAVEFSSVGMTVSNPQAPELRESVVCRQAVDGAWHWWWPWRQSIYSQTTTPITLRTREQVAAWFDGFTLAPPGLVDADAWRRAGSRKTTAPIMAGVGILNRKNDGG